MFAIGEGDFKSVASFFGGGFDTAICFQFYAGAAGGIQQAINDSLRRISSGKHTAITFNLQFDAPAFKPGNGVARLEFSEGGNERALAAWVTFGKFARIEIRVGNITPAAARDFDLGKKVR